MRCFKKSRKTLFFLLIFIVVVYNVPYLLHPDPKRASVSALPKIAPAGLGSILRSLTSGINAQQNSSIQVEGKVKKQKINAGDDNVAREGVHDDGKEANKPPSPSPNLDVYPDNPAPSQSPEYDLYLAHHKRWHERYGAFTLAEPDTTASFMLEHGNVTCLREGSDARATFAEGNKCVCAPGWYGAHCSIPRAVCVRYPDDYDFPLRLKPRRIVQSFLYNIEWEMLHARLQESAGLVEAYLVQEALFTSYGDPKNTTLLPYMLGHASNLSTDVKRRFVHSVMFNFPSGPDASGFLHDTTMRNFAFRNGSLPRALSNVSDDDIFMHGDADEVPSRETLLFLKLHDNIPEPVGLTLAWRVYGFFWQTHKVGISITMAATFGMMRTVFKMQPNALRGSRSLSLKPQIDKYMLMHPGTKRGPLQIGDAKTPAGYHCSWCTSPIGIRNKLISAQNADFPRWGDYPGKCELCYIEHLVATGTWFSEQSCLEPRTVKEANYAPTYFLQNPELYAHLLFKPSTVSLACKQANVTIRDATCKPKTKPQYGQMIKDWHRMTKGQFLKSFNGSYIAQNLLDILKD